MFVLSSPTIGYLGYHYAVYSPTLRKRHFQKTYGCGSDDTPKAIKPDVPSTTSTSFVDSLVGFIRSFMTVMLLGAMSFAAYGHDGPFSMF